MTQREQFEAAISRLTEEQRREVRLLARPFEWTRLKMIGQDVWGRCRDIHENDIVVRGTSDSLHINAYCTKCRFINCVHGLALKTLYYGGHPMKTVRDREVGR
jgi:hypothetical protein